MVERSRKKFDFGCAIFLAFCFFGVIVTLLFAWYLLGSGEIASSAALPQNKIPQNQLSKISRIVDLRPSENILYFYSAAIKVANDGNLFTNERVISYASDSTSSWVTDAEYAEVQDIAFIPSTSWLDDSTITITLRDSSTFDLWVSAESGRDKLFYNRLIQEWRENQGDVAIQD